MGERGIPWDVRSRDQEGVFSGAPLLVCAEEKARARFQKEGWESQRLQMPKQMNCRQLAAVGFSSGSQSKTLLRQTSKPTVGCEDHENQLHVKAHS